MKGLGTPTAAKTEGTKTLERRQVFYSERNMPHVAFLLEYFPNLGRETEAELLSQVQASPQSWGAKWSLGLQKLPGIQGPRSQRQSRLGEVGSHSAQGCPLRLFLILKLSRSEAMNMNRKQKRSEVKGLFVVGCLLLATSWC